MWPVPIATHGHWLSDCTFTKVVAAQAELEQTGLAAVLDDIEAGSEHNCRAPQLREAMVNRKHLNLLSGCLPALREFCHWLGVICEVPTGRLFLAGDTDLKRTGTMFLPAGCELPSVGASPLSA